MIAAPLGPGLVYLPCDRLEALPGPLRDALFQMLEGALLAHDVTNLGRKAQKPRTAEAIKASI